VHPPGPPLTDGVVTLRPGTIDDAPAVAAACAEDEIARWMPPIPQPSTEVDGREYILGTERAWRDGTGGTFAVVESATREVVGSMGMRVLDREQAVVEAGYPAAAPARGRGLTRRALRLISAWLLDTVRAERVQLRADALDVASQRVAERPGFVREWVLRSSAFSPRQRRRIDYAVFSLLPGELR
jgi:RimJ/RimL family protein N-acetyltransferase